MFDKSREFKLIRYSNNSEYQFDTSGGDTISVSFTKTPIVGLVFEIKFKSLSSDVYNLYNFTGNGESLEILSTIKAIIFDFVSRNKKISIMCRSNDKLFNYHRKIMIELKDKFNMEAFEDYKKDEIILTALSKVK